jgi:hypothetical protein
MAELSSVVVVAYPREKLWRRMCDGYLDTSVAIDGVESVTQTSRSIDDRGCVHTTQVWTADLSALGNDGVATAVVQQLTTPEMRRWSEDAVWDPRTFVCAWNITHHGLREALACSGETRFETAMGGRGTRVQFAGTLTVNFAAPGVAAIRVPFASSWIETVIARVVMRNLRSTLEGVARTLA